MRADLVAAYPEDHARAYLGILAELAPDAAGVLRSTYGRETVEEIGAREGFAVRVLTWDAWRAGAIAAQRAVVAMWQPTTRARYWDGLEVLPPIAWRGGAFLVGEPCDHDHATGAPRYQAFRERGSEPFAVWDTSSRPVTVAELDANRTTPRGVAWST